MFKWVLLIVGGVTGTLLRYVISSAATRTLGYGFPYGTLAVNLIGCFILGFFAIILEEKFILTPHDRLLLLVGFCGAFTTFSTFILDSTTLIQNGESLKAFSNIMLSVALGFLALKLGVRLGALAS